MSRTTSNVYKSEEGWRRFRERTENGARKRSAFMDHRVQSTLPKWDGVIPPAEGDDEPRRSRKRRRVSAPNGRTF